MGPEGYGAYKGWWVNSGQLIAADGWGMARALKGETSVGDLVRIQCFDGPIKTILHSAAPLVDARGGIVGAVCVIEDITALSDAQQRLQQSETLFRSVFEMSPVGLHVTDREGHVTHENPESQRIWEGRLHVAPAEMGEYRAWRSGTGQPLAAADEAVAPAVLGGETSRNKMIRIECFDGTLKSVLNAAAPIRGQDGESTGGVTVNQDVSGLVAMQEQLRMAVQDREHILAVVAHDLRSPLASISMGGAVLQRKAAGCMTGQACKVASGFIMDASRRMAGLVDDLLAVSVGPAGGAMLKLAPVQVSELISMAAQQTAALADKAGLQLEWQQDSDLGTIQVDIDRILRVFGNLLDNALKFTEPGGRVVLRAEAAPGAVLFSVANSGPPVPAEDLERMFRPFWQAARDDRRGAGLGLSICRATVEAHGGTVRAEAAPGMRLKILFVLPRGRQQDPVAPAAQRQPPEI